MRVDVERKRNRGVAEPLAHHLGMNAGSEDKGGVGVPQIVLVPMSAQAHHADVRVMPTSA